MMDRKSLSGRWLAGLAVLAAVFCLVVERAEAAGDTAVITVEIGKAKMVRLETTPDVIMLGNPAVADVVVEDNGMLFLLGREPGETNLMILDETGKVVLSSPIVVGPVQKRRVTVDNGVESFTLSCNPRCVPVATPQGTGATTPATAGATGEQAEGEEEQTAGGEQAAGGDQAAALANALGSLMGNQQEQQ
ncbi:MAG: pilus assembly protein N-terminal domain-containing protein [Alphaproteobacteria bacterium]|jgi:hypothetical protein|nr:pilus assembly protein N-terminal domain-containing protein [Alphaproteobacteria bacterium]MDP6874401.1 pilus assembly protein N-terminal domain-containing protein [Alphaproteobacteria bacterium]